MTPLLRLRNADICNMNKTYHLKSYSLRRLSNPSHRMCTYSSTHDPYGQLWTHQAVRTPPGPRAGRASVSSVVAGHPKGIATVVASCLNMMIIFLFIMYVFVVIVRENILMHVNIHYAWVPIFFIVNKSSKTTPHFLHFIYNIAFKTCLGWCVINHLSSKHFIACHSYYSISWHFIAYHNLSKRNMTSICILMLNRAE